MRQCPAPPCAASHDLGRARGADEGGQVQVLEGAAGGVCGGGDGRRRRHQNPAGQGAAREGRHRDWESGRKLTLQVTGGSFQGWYRHQKFELSPLGHSRSPRLRRGALRRSGSGRYEALPLPGEGWRAPRRGRFRSGFPWVEMERN
jgi:hypothetical protein